MPLLQTEAAPDASPTLRYFLDFQDKRQLFFENKPRAKDRPRPEKKTWLFKRKIYLCSQLFIKFIFSQNVRQVEYGHFKRRDGGRDSRDRDRNRSFRDRGDNRDRGGDFRERGDFRDREPEESVFSKRVRAGKRRTYFFDVRKTRGNDFFVTITESTRREDGFGYKRHKIFLYKEDFNRFVASLSEVVNHVKNDLMPEFDYEEFDRRQAEWEAQNRDAEDEQFDDQHAEENDADDTNDRKKDDDEISW